MFSRSLHKILSQNISSKSLTHGSNFFFYWSKPGLPAELYQSSSVDMAKNNAMESLCSINSFKRCLSIIKAVTQSDQMAFASTEEDLNAACR